jgi:hypothetical protein
MNYPRLRPGIFYHPETFRWSAYQLGWREAMLSADGRVVPLATARTLRGSSVRAFIRPDSDSKAFEGGLYDDVGLATATRRTSVSETTPVVFASPVKIEAEWRFFIVKSEVVGCSEYRHWGRLSTDGSVPHAAIEYAYECASRWGPADIYCLDLGATENRIGIVEANCFNASRFYGAAIDRILQAVNAHVLTLFGGS